MTPHQTHQLPAVLDISELPVRETAELERAASDWPTRAQSVVIEDQESYDEAIQLLRGVKDLRKQAAEHHKPMIAAAHAAHGAALAGLKRIDDPLSLAEATIKDRIGAWDALQTRLARQREQFLREEAQRIAAENLEKELLAREALGAPAAEIKAVIEEAERRSIPVPQVAPMYTKAKGISTTPKWSATVTDLAQLIAYVAKNPQYSTLLSVNQVALNNLVRAQQQNLNLPGVQVSDGVTVGVR